MLGTPSFIIIDHIQANKSRTSNDVNVEHGGRTNRSDLEHSRSHTRLGSCHTSDLFHYPLYLYQISMLCCTRVVGSSQILSAQPCRSPSNFSKCGQRWRKIHHSLGLGRPNLSISRKDRSNCIDQAGGAVREEAILHLRVCINEQPSPNPMVWNN